MTPLSLDIRQTETKKNDAVKLKCDPRDTDVNKTEKYYKWDIVWLHVWLFLYFHTAGGYGLYLFLTACKWPTLFWCIYLKIIGNIGASAATHRLWSHNAFKATLPLRILFAYFQSTCYQGPVYYWVRNHRLHHKFTDTDGDPHNSRRGLFFCHIGFLLMKPHKDVTTRRTIVNMKDIEADSVVMFQKRYYLFLMPFFCFILPSVVPWYFFGESFTIAWHVSMFRFILNLHETFTINSLNHWFGARPYDKNIYPTQNWLVHWLTLGEGWHNYHHVFPFDYRSSELYGDNLATNFIDLCAKIGWAYDLKTASKEMIAKRKLRTGPNDTASLSGFKYLELKSAQEPGNEELLSNKHVDVMGGSTEKLY